MFRPPTSFGKAPRSWQVWGLILFAGLLAGAGLVPSPEPLALSSKPDSLLDHPCADCHFPEVTAGIGSSAHAGVVMGGAGCEDCHGSAVIAHGKTGTLDGLIRYTPGSPTPTRLQNETCLTCHTRNPGMFWPGSTHDQEGLACATCHHVMAPAAAPASLWAQDGFNSAERNLCNQCHPRQGFAQMRSSHLNRGGLQCSSCHNPHGGTGPRLLKEATASEQCLDCHEDKRGPFLFEHPVVEDGCLGCHDPHASNHDSLLKVSRPTLCLECHSQVDFFHEANGIATRYVVNRGCQNCHGLIHGSNHPAGSRLQR